MNTRIRKGFSKLSLLVSVYLLPWIDIQTVQAYETSHSDDSSQKSAFFCGKVVKNEFATQEEIVHLLKWGPSHDSEVTGYRIFQGNDLIFESNNSEFKVLIPNRCEDKNYTYELIAIHSDGSESCPLTIQLGHKKKDCTFALSFSTSIVNNTCNGGTLGQITINAKGGTKPYLYSKDGGTTFQSIKTFLNLTPGTYQLVVKDANNCLASGTATVTADSNVSFTATIVNPNNSPTFNNGSITINATGGTGTLVYSNNFGMSFQTSNVFTNLTQGTYGLMVLDKVTLTTFTGSLTIGDQTQIGRLVLNSVKATCIAPKRLGLLSCPGIFGDDPHLFDSYSFVNTSLDTICVNVELLAGCNRTTNPIMVAAYYGNFNPTSICENYIADPGIVPVTQPSANFSFLVPTELDYEIVVSEVNSLVGCSDYTLNVFTTEESDCAQQSVILTNQ